MITIPIPPIDIKEPVGEQVAVPILCAKQLSFVYVSKDSEKEFMDLFNDSARKIRRFGF